MPRRLVWWRCPVLGGRWCDFGTLRRQDSQCELWTGCLPKGLTGQGGGQLLPVSWVRGGLQAGRQACIPMPERIRPNPERASPIPEHVGPAVRIVGDHLPFQCHLQSRVCPVVSV
jgi:hypothetical protein